MTREDEGCRFPLQRLRTSRQTQSSRAWTYRPLLLMNFFDSTRLADLRLSLSSPLGFLVDLTFRAPLKKSFLYGPFIL